MVWMMTAHDTPFHADDRCAHRAGFYLAPELSSEVLFYQNELGLLFGMLWNYPSISSHVILAP